MMLPQALLVQAKPNHWGVFPGFGMVRPQARSQLNPPCTVR